MKTPLLLLILAAPLAGQAPNAEPSLDIVICEVNGEVDCQAASAGDKPQWVEAKAGMHLSPGARIGTGIESSALLAFGDRALLVIEEASLVRVDSFGLVDGRVSAKLFIDPGLAVGVWRRGVARAWNFETRYSRLTGALSRREVVEPDPPEGTPEYEHWVEMCKLGEAARAREREIENRERIVAYGGFSPGFPYDVGRSLLELPIDQFIADVASGSARVPSGTLCDRVRFLRGQAFLFEAGFPALAVYLDIGGSEDLRAAAKKELASLRLSDLEPRPWTVAREIMPLSNHAPDLEH